jgi:transposase
MQPEARVVQKKRHRAIARRLSSKLHAAVDTKGKPLEIIITPGQQHDSTVAEHLIDFIAGEACIADLAYDADRILDELKQRGMKAVIPSSKGRKKQRRHDKELYKLRYLVECFFHNIKRFRRVATRYDKTAVSYAAFVQVACAFQWLL